MTSRTAVAVVIATFVLCGCAPSMNAAVDTIRAAIRGTGGASPNAVLNPNASYLRVTLDGRLAFVAFAGEDQHAVGPVQVWVSADGAVLRFRDGRLVGATGLMTEWRDVLLPQLPSWSTLAELNGQYHWARIRDVMPGYRYGVRDELLVQRISAPPRSRLQGLDPQRLSWFEERLRVSGSFGSPELPPARYAVDLAAGIVVYGEQCLARDLCFAWQRWSGGS